MNLGTMKSLYFSLYYFCVIYINRDLFVFTTSSNEIFFGNEFSIIQGGLMIIIDLPYCLFLAKVFLEFLLFFLRLCSFDSRLSFNHPCLDDHAVAGSTKRQFMFSLFISIYIPFWVCFNLSNFRRFFIFMFNWFWYRWIYCRLTFTYHKRGLNWEWIIIIIIIRNVSHI